MQISGKVATFHFWKDFEKFIESLSIKSAKSINPEKVENPHKNLNQTWQTHITFVIPHY